MGQNNMFGFPVEFYAAFYARGTRDSPWIEILDKSEEGVGRKIAEPAHILFEAIKTIDPPAVVWFFNFVFFHGLGLVIRG